MSGTPMIRRARRRRDEPTRLVEVERVLSREECDEIFQRVTAFANGGGETAVGISSWWQGEVRWARNRVSLASDRRNDTVVVQRTIHNGMSARITTNQLDDRSLEAAVRAAERASAMVSRMGHGVGFYPKLPEYERPAGAIWSDATYGLLTEQRSKIARSLVAPAESKGMLSAGYLEVRAASSAVLGDAFPELRSSARAFWEEPYNAWTQAQCSTTVRDQNGLGSGWAGLSSFDWAAIDAEALGARALEKCIASQNPVALEPGRYTVILEPQAVADFMETIVGTFAYREIPENGLDSPWLLGKDDALVIWRTKLGLKVVDARITISHDTADPALGVVASQTEQPGKVTFIDRGVLTALGHRLDTDIASLRGSHHLRGATGYRMSGGETSVEEMIRTTKRGLLVTRLSNIRGLDDTSGLSTGLTRDGLWLVENGKITKAVKNFRFTESPLFMLNSIEQLGVPVPVFRPTRHEGDELTPAIVPPLKVRDFSFTSTIDAI
ncbi:MAG TPA: metallopeptidase TldD-related protein [Gemmatimonadaceae bacterium]